MEVLGKAARVFSGIPVERSDNAGTAMLFEAASARAGRLSSAAAKNTRDLCPPAKGGKTDLSEKIARFINFYLFVKISSATFKTSSTVMALRQIKSFTQLCARHSIQPASFLCKTRSLFPVGPHLLGLKPG
jgi:hypothetical protein